MRLQEIQKNTEVSCENLSVGYGKIPILKDINYTVKPGEILCLIGPNGCGKSTILKTMTGQLEKIAGTVYLGKLEMQKLKQTEIAKKMSMVTTARIKTEFMSCREVVATGRYPYTGKFGILSQEDWELVDEAMDLLHASKIAEQDFMKISDGQRQRVLLARAICQNTDILILDEPTSYLDMRYKLELLSCIRDMAKKKKIAVILSLHELDLVWQIADVIACIDGKKIDKIGRAEDIFKGDYIQKLYGVSELEFNPILGTMHLPVEKKEPEVFVIGGGGSGVATYHRLQREKIPFAVGVLGENDLEYSIAKAAATKVIKTKAFYPITDKQVKQAKKLIDACKYCICTLQEFGPYNEANKDLYEYAKENEKLKGES